MGRIGLLSNYRNNGLGKRVFLDTINMVYKLDKKYLRVLVNDNVHSKVEELCIKYMDIKEDYKDAVIYSKNLSKDLLIKWNNRFIDISNE